jgi:hypothetical protein
MEYTWINMLINNDSNKRWSNIIDEDRFNKYAFQSTYKLLKLDYVNEDLLQIRISILKPGDHAYNSLTPTDQSSADALDLSQYEFYYRNYSDNDNDNDNNAIYISTHPKPFNRGRGVIDNRNTRYPMTNRSGPIQRCNSRFANCNINKGPYPSGSTINNSYTLAQRVSNQIQVQSYFRNSKWTFKTAPVNGYGQRSGGPNGYGQSPKNTF